jgi:hypothetical protein
VKRLGHIRNVGNHSLDTVTATFDLGLKRGHLITVRTI